jgi:hypothetical protein
VFLLASRDMCRHVSLRSQSHGDDTVSIVLHISDGHATKSVWDCRVY